MHQWEGQYKPERYFANHLKKVGLGRLSIFNFHPQSLGSLQPQQNFKCPIAQCLHNYTVLWQVFVEIPEKDTFDELRDGNLYPGSRNETSSWNPTHLPACSLRLVGL